MEPPLQDRTIGPLYIPPSISEERREQKRLLARQRRQAMTDEQRERERLRARRRRMVMTEGQREQQRIRLRRLRMVMTEEQREQERLRRRRYLEKRNEQQISYERQRNRLYQRQRRNSLRKEHSGSSEQMTLPLNENANKHQPLVNTPGNIQEHAQVSSVLHKQVQGEASRISGVDVMRINKGSRGDTQKLHIDLNNDLNTPLEGENSEEMNASKGNLGKHLNRLVSGGYDKMDVDDVWCPTLQTTETTLAKKAQASQLDFDHLNWLLLRWLIGGSLPLSTLEDKWLMKSFKFVNPLVNIWSMKSFQAVILEVFSSMREDVRASLEHVNSKVSITLDLWTSYEQISYMSITGHWIDENWSLHKVLLDISRIPYPFASADIYRTLVKVLKMYNIDENRILSCTHDNSQNTFDACHTLKEDLDGRRKTGSFFYIPCAARTLNRIIEDGLRTAIPVISKIREFVLEMNTSVEILEDFKQITSYQEGSWKFPIVSSTRWNGNYTMLDIVCKASKSMDAVIGKHEESFASRNMLLNSAEKNAVNAILAYLEPFHKTTNNICTSKVPTIGLVLFFMDHIVWTIASCRGSCQSPDWLKTSAEDMARKVRSYNSQVYNIYTFMAAILDPRIKGELIPENLNLESHLEDARNHFVRNYSTTSHLPATANDYNSQEDNEDGGGSVSFPEEIAQRRRRVNMSTTTDELSQYLSEPPAPFTTDVLEWWKGNSSRYPRLSVMARDFLAVQPTSVSPDEIFCDKGDEIDKQRFCLPHGSTQAVLCIRSWTESGFKLKCRSTEIDFEKIMESAGATAASASSNCTTGSESSDS